MIHNNPILLAGAPRTATSWVAKVLSLGRGIRYVREPINHGQPNGYEACLYRYLTANDDAPEYMAVWQSVLSMRWLIEKRWLASQSRPLYRMPVLPARLLVKEVNCVLAMDWIAARLKMKVALTIRHPCGHVASGLRMKGEGMEVVNLERLLEQPTLMNQYFANEQDWLCGLTDPIEKMAASYGIIYKVLGEQLRYHPEWVIVHHEALCDDAPGQFYRLFHALGMQYTQRVDDFLKSSDHTADANLSSEQKLWSLSRRRAEEPTKWKSELTPLQIDAVARIIARFRLPFYREFA
jgi:hypothetical protein